MTKHTMSEAAIEQRRAAGKVGGRVTYDRYGEDYLKSISRRGGQRSQEVLAEKRASGEIKRKGRNFPTWMSLTMVEDIKRLAKRTGITPSAVVREAVQTLLDEEKQADEQARASAAQSDARGGTDQT
jgi:predicted DNA-binding protein